MLPSGRELAEARVRLIRAGRRVDVVLDDAERHNPQTPSTWRVLARLAQGLQGQADVVVIRGSGPSFSAGMDRAAMVSTGPDGLAGLAAMPPDDAEDRIATFQAAFLPWADRAFLSIAAVRGHAIGAGLQLALACDLRIAADDVRLSMKEPQLGLVPDLGGTARLVEAVGYARALHLCVTGQAVDADQALAWGLVQQVVPSAELDAAVDVIASAVTGLQRDAVLATRALLRRRREDVADQAAAERRAQVLRLHALAARGPG